MKKKKILEGLLNLTEIESDDGFTVALFYDNAQDVAIVRTRNQSFYCGDLDISPNKQFIKAIKRAIKAHKRGELV
jgi:hypothetical protein